jgi:hypothetical protein
VCSERKQVEIMLPDDVFASGSSRTGWHSASHATLLRIVGGHLRWMLTAYTAAAMREHWGVAQVKDFTIPLTNPAANSSIAEETSSAYACTFGGHGRGIA